MNKKESIKKNKAKRAYEFVCSDYAINTESPFKEQISKLVDEACKIQEKIDEGMSEIKSVYYPKFVEALGQDVSERLWMELVNLNNKRGYATEAAVDKMKSKVEDELFAINTKHLFLNNDFGESFTTGENIVKYPESVDFTSEDDYSTDEEADKILTEATEKRSYIGRTLMSEYKRIFKAVAYLVSENTDEEIKSSEFKMIVDFKHYATSVTNEGNETEESKDKLEGFVNKILTAWKVSRLLGQTTFDDYLKAKNLKISGGLF